MGAGFHGGFGQTHGSRGNLPLPMNLQFFASKVFEPGGSISEKSFSEHGTFFLGKSVNKIQKALHQQGYKTHVERSRHAKSKAKRIIVDNSSKTKNIAIVQVSSSSKRHGDTPYVKVSTTNNGIFKIVSDKSKYKSDGNETAKIYFARRKRKND